jgi:hypothetical protein
MKPTTLHTLLFTILFSAVSIFSANAQLTYSGGRLSLDTTPIGSYKVSIAGNGAYFKLPSQTNFFQIDISSENTRLAGHGDQISFYNSSTNKYNSINVLNVYYHSDARAKTNVRDFSQGLEVISRIRPVTYNFIRVKTIAGLLIRRLASLHKSWRRSYRALSSRTKRAINASTTTC